MCLPVGLVNAYVLQMCGGCVCWKPCALGENVECQRFPALTTQSVNFFEIWKVAALQNITAAKNQKFEPKRYDPLEQHAPCAFLVTCWKRRDHLFAVRKGLGSHTKTPKNCESLKRFENSAAKSKSKKRRRKKTKKYKSYNLSYKFL